MARSVWDIDETSSQQRRSLYKRISPVKWECPDHTYQQGKAHRARRHGHKTGHRKSPENRGPDPESLKFWRACGLESKAPLDSD